MKYVEQWFDAQRRLLEVQREAIVEMAEDGRRYSKAATVANETLNLRGR